jgi:hypothetical protein
MNASRPDAQQAARRLVILGGLVRYADEMPPLSVWRDDFPKWSPEEQTRYFNEFKKLPQSIANSFRSSGVWNDLSPREDRFLHTYPQDLKFQDRLNFSWRKESAVALLWALGFLPELPAFDRESDPELLSQVPRENAARFIESATLRSPEELENRRALAQSWHWRSRTRQLIEADRPFPETALLPNLRNYDDVVRFSARALKQEGALPEIIDADFPAKGKAYRDLTRDEWQEVRSVTMERHFALNWLCGYAPGGRWDDTPTET